ncbi:MAG TPA: DNA-directed RNA polymerase subunit K [Nitrososphaerales archaeon]|nr:DNA-directed RNA polymerase subunit K [Nitrososphaerales archaeon]
MSKKKTGKNAAKASKEKKIKISISIGPPRLTRFERARVIGARSLQLALGAPSFIHVPSDITDPISLALLEIEKHALPLSIRRSLPNDVYQDIPIDALMY